LLLQTWQDLKKQIKKKNSEITKYVSGTGGGPATNTVLTADEETLLNLLDSTAVEGDLQVKESFIFVNMIHLFLFSALYIYLLIGYF
jgi:hypothetical protein